MKFVKVFRRFGKPKDSVTQRPGVAMQDPLTEAQEDAEYAFISQVEADAYYDSHANPRKTKDDPVHADWLGRRLLACKNPCIIIGLGAYRVCRFWSIAEIPETSEVLREVASRPVFDRHIWFNEIEESWFSYYTCLKDERLSILCHGGRWPHLAQVAFVCWTVQDRVSEKRVIKTMRANKMGRLFDQELVDWVYTTLPAGVDLRAVMVEHAVKTNYLKALKGPLEFFKEAREYMDTHHITDVEIPVELDVLDGSWAVLDHISDTMCLKSADAYEISDDEPQAPKLSRSSTQERAPEATQGQSIPIESLAESASTAQALLDSLNEPSSQSYRTVLSRPRTDNDTPFASYAAPKGMEPTSSMGHPRPSNSIFSDPKARFVPNSITERYPKYVGGTSPFNVESKVCQNNLRKSIAPFWRELPARPQPSLFELQDHSPGPSVIHHPPPRSFIAQGNAFVPSGNISPRPNPSSGAPRTLIPCRQPGSSSNRHGGMQTSGIPAPHLFTHHNTSGSHNPTCHPPTPHNRSHTSHIPIPLRSTAYVGSAIPGSTTSMAWPQRGGSLKYSNSVLRRKIQSQQEDHGKEGPVRQPLNAPPVSEIVQCPRLNFSWANCK